MPAVDQPFLSPPSRPWMIGLIGTWLSVIAAAACAADKAESSGSSESLVGTRVDVTLASGETVANVKVVAARPGKREGSYATVTVADPDSGKPVRLSAPKIREISAPGGEALLVYDAMQKALVPPKDARRPAAAAAPAGTAAPVTGLNDRQQEKAVAAQRVFLDQIGGKVPNLGLRLYETKRFLFYSDIPAPIVATYVRYLDDMYVRLCSAYGINAAVNIWKGKATIVAFANKASFVQFESAFYNTPPEENVQGLAHSRGDGSVVISCYAGSDSRYFAVILVHETAHGFTRRYFGGNIPSWLNEGISDWVANAVVVGNPQIPRKVERAVRQMQLTRSLGGDFFTAEHISDWQYGAAAGMITFLLAYNPSTQSAPPPRSASKARRAESEPTAFRKFLDGIKSGSSWQESLQAAYGLTPAELAQRYGQANGIPDLRP